MLRCLSRRNDEMGKSGNGLTLFDRSDANSNLFSCHILSQIAIQACTELAHRQCLTKTPLNSSFPHGGKMERVHFCEEADTPFIFYSEEHVHCWSRP